MIPSPSSVRQLTGPNGRFYDVEREVSRLTGTSRFPSVTTILAALAKPALMPWAAKQERELVAQAAADLYEDVKGTPPMARSAYVTTLQARISQVRAYQRDQQKALEIGSQAHALIEHQIRKGLGQKVGPEPKVRPEALWAVMSAEDWFAAHRVKPVFTEAQVWSPVHGFAGTVDLLAYVDGRLAVIDWKSSKSIYAESDLQNIAYQQCLVDLGHQAPETGYVIRIPKTTDETAVEVHEVPPRSDLLPTFLALCDVWRWWWASEEASRQAYQRRKGAAA